MFLTALRACWWDTTRELRQQLLRRRSSLSLMVIAPAVMVLKTILALVHGGIGPSVLKAEGREPCFDRRHALPVW